MTAGTSRLQVVEVFDLRSLSVVARLAPWRKLERFVGGTYLTCLEVQRLARCASRSRTYVRADGDVDAVGGLGDFRGLHDM